jgi:hypothetical protein
VKYFLSITTALFLAYSSTLYGQQILGHDSIIVDATDSIVGSDSIPVVEARFDSLSYFSSELKFAHHLISNEQYNDAKFLLHKLQSESSSATQSHIDSINHLLGWTTYFNREFNEAIDLFSKVSTSSDIGVQSKFYKSICFVYTQEYDSAKATLISIDLDSGEMLWELSILQLSAIALLEREYTTYDSLSSFLSGRHFQFATEETGMASHSKDLSGYKQKSPWIAGGLSALFPGLGKFYAGYIGLPFGTMSMTLPLAAVAIEAALVAGILSPPFLILGGVFAVFYVGNIWGSALSVYTIKKEIYDEIDRNIVFDMHVPLRRVFW